MTLDQQAIVFRLQDEKGVAQDRSASQRDLTMSRGAGRSGTERAKNLDSHLLHIPGVTSVSRRLQSPLVTDMLQSRES